MQLKTIIFGYGVWKNPDKKIILNIAGRMSGKKAFNVHQKNQKVDKLFITFSQTINNNH